MKSLLLIRHAKSSWSNHHLDDFDRPLNGRGKKNAPVMGARLAAAGIRPDLIITSPALRALATAQAMATEMDHANEDIQLQPKLLHASAAGILDVARDCPASVQCLAVIGHNPGMHEAVEQLSMQRIEEFRTCAVAFFSWHGPWNELEWGAADMLFLSDPRQSGEFT